MFTKKSVLAGGGVLFLVFALGVLQKKPHAPVQETTGGLFDADMIFSKISFVRMRDGSKDFELTAKEAKWYDPRHTALLTDIGVTMPAGSWGPIMLSGSQGTMDTEGQNFSLRGGKEPVSVQWGNDYTLKTASVAWSAEERFIYTHDPVVLSGEGIVIQGTGMQVSPDRSEMILKNVHAEIY